LERKLKNAHANKTLPNCTHSLPVLYTLFFCFILVVVFVVVAWLTQKCKLKTLQLIGKLNNAEESEAKGL